MGTILLSCALYYVLWTLVLSIFPRPTAAERAAEDADFVAEMARRRGDRT